MSTWLPAAPCTPGACIRSAVPAVRAVHALLRLAALVAVTGAGVVLSPFVVRCPAALRDRVVRRWCRVLARTVGVRLRTEGVALPSGGLLVANHISWLDVPLLAAVRPARMLAKSEVRAWPLAGALAARGGTLFIERDRPSALPGTVARIAEALRGGAAVAVFPEGSTWCGRAGGRFRRAAFQAALDAGVPVQPVRIRYLGPGGAPGTAAAFVGDDSLGASLWRVARARGLHAEVTVLPALQPGAYPDRRALALAAQRSIGLAGSWYSGQRPSPELVLLDPVAVPAPVSRSRRKP